MSHPLDNAVIFGSPGMGEVIVITPLIAALKSPTLVIREWQLPIFDRLGWDIKTFKHDPRSGRKVNISREHANELGLDHRPCIAPVMKDGVFVDGKIPNGFVAGVKGQCKKHLSLTEKIMAEYGVEGSSLMHVSKVSSPSTGRTLTIASSGEALRVVPIHVIGGIVERLSGWRINIVSKLDQLEKEDVEKVNSGRNELVFCYPSSLKASEFYAVLEKVQSSNVVVASDCGWAYAAMASGIKTFNMHSRALFESVVPKIYWGGVGELVDPIKDPSCDRQCSAQRLIAAMPPNSPRPFHEFENFSQMTPEWRTNCYNRDYPNTLACWGSYNPPCLNYDNEAIERLTDQIKLQVTF